MSDIAAHTGWWIGAGMSGALLVLELVIGVVLSNRPPYFIRRRTNPAFYWLGIMWVALAFMVFLLVATVRTLAR